MRKNIKFFVGLLVSATVIFVIMQVLGRFLDPLGAGEGFAAIEAFDSWEDNSLDVIVYGSSHAWKGCDTNVMHDEYGLEAYNYGCNWQALNTTLLFLRDSLRTQKPKVVCIECFMVNSLLHDWNMEGQIYYTKAMDDFPGKRAYLKQCFGKVKERYLSYYVPLVMFHDNWAAITEENFKEYSPEVFIDSRGYSGSAEIQAYSEPDYKNFKQEGLYDICREALENIVAECNERDIELIFYTAPYANEYNFDEVMKEFAEEHDCVFLNLFEHTEEMDFDWNKDLRDSGHLNDSGSGKVARYLSEYIIENYNVSDWHS